MGQSAPRFLVSGLIMLTVILGTSQRAVGRFQEGKNPNNIAKKNPCCHLNNWIFE